MYIKVVSMRKKNPPFETHISFSIKTNDVEPSIITKELGIWPDISFIKGDSYASNFSKTIGYREWNLWTIESPWTTLDEETVSHHIKYFKEILLPHAEILKRYKQNNNFELSFFIMIRSYDAGFFLNLPEEEMSFLNKYANRTVVAVSIMSDNEVKKT